MDPQRGLSPRGFVFVSLMTTLSFVSALAVFGLVVDPHGLHRVFESPWLNVIKPRASQAVIPFKYRTIEDLRPRTIVLGNSRAEMGLDPEHIAKSGFGLSANLAVPGSGLDTMRTIADFSWEVSKPSTILLGLEFFDCLSSGASRPRYVRTPPPWPARADEMTALRSKIRRTSVEVFSLDTVSDAIATIVAQYRSGTPHLRRDGFQPGRDYVEFVRVDGPRKMFQQRENETARIRARGPRSIRYDNGDLSECFADYDGILEDASKRSQHVVAFTYPYHARLLESINALGLWPAYEAWKREITRLAQASKIHGANVVLLDFGAYHSYATEPIPATGKREPIPNWYWESGHFKAELGDRMIDRITGRRGGDELFGMELTELTIDATLDLVRASRSRFIDSQPEVAREMAVLVRQAESRSTDRP